MLPTDPYLVLKDYKENLVLSILPGLPSGNNITDLSGNNHTITKVDSPTRVSGGNIAVLDFTSGGKIVIDDANDLDIIDNPMSYCFWYKCDTYDGSAKLFNKGSNIKMGPVSISDKLQHYTYLFDVDENDETEIYQTSASKQIAGEWYFIVLAIDFDTSNIKLYQDAEMILSKNRSMSDLVYSNSSDIVLGKDGLSQFPGQIALFRMYNKILSADEIKQIYQYTRRHVMGLSPKK